MNHTTEEITTKLKLFYGDSYDYSSVKYVSYKNKIRLICPKHGEFFSRTDHLLNGSGCPKCSRQNQNKHYFTENFKKDAEKVCNSYDYTQVEYINNYTDVKIKCPKHGFFYKQPANFLFGSWICPKCSLEIMSKNKSLTREEFITKAKEIHGNKYDYSELVYIGENSKSKFICPKHGVFEQLCYVHLRGCGCPKCKESNGEKIISEWLDSKKIKYEREKKFKKLSNRHRFDFYLPDKNVLIEFDGIQHFESVEHFGGEKYLKKIKERDELKNNFAKENNFKLIRIKYDQNVEEVLNEKINQ